jgi:uncharacterized membrane protein
MMTLLILLLLIIGPFLLLSLAGWWIPKTKLTPAMRARVGLSLFFTFTASGHFIQAEAMSAMLPPAIPYRMGIIHFTGLLEVLGAIGVWLPRMMRFTGFCLMLMLVVFLLANIYSAMYRVDFGGHGSGPAYLLLRIPFQCLVIGWVYYATEQQWFVRRSRAA